MHSHQACLIEPWFVSAVCLDANQKNANSHLFVTSLRADFFNALSPWAHTFRQGEQTKRGQAFLVSRVGHCLETRNAFLLENIGILALHCVVRVCVCACAYLYAQSVLAGDWKYAFCLDKPASFSADSWLYGCSVSTAFLYICMCAVCASAAHCVKNDAPLGQLASCPGTKKGTKKKTKTKKITNHNYQVSRSARFPRKGVGGVFRGVKI